MLTVSPNLDPPLQARRKRTQVLIAMYWLDHELMLGIAQYGREAGWIVNDLPVHTGQVPATWNGDGVLAMLNWPEGPFIDFVKSLKCPVVDFAQEVNELPVPRVVTDNHAVGTAGAQHLLDRGLEHFAFVRIWDTHAEAERLKGMSDRLAAAGYSCTVIDGRLMNLPETDTGELARWIGEQISPLPRPLGVMCQHDRESMLVINGCRGIGLRIPEDVCVIGANNDTLICELGLIPLSSVDIHRREQGYRACQLLDRLMRGESVEDQVIRIAPGPVVTRQSTDVLAVPDPVLARALQFIARHYREQIQVADIVAAADTTRRSLYKLFEVHLGRSIHAEVLRRRIEHAKQLLTTTPQKLATIAEATGFLDAQSLTRVFQRELKISPSQYRLRHAKK